MVPISGGKLQQIDLKNKQQDNIPVMGSEKNGNLLDCCNYLDDNRDSYQLGIREEVIMKTIFLILILCGSVTDEGNGQYTIRDQNGDIVGEVDRAE